MCPWLVYCIGNSNPYLIIHFYPKSPKCQWNVRSKLDQFRGLNRTLSEFHEILDLVVSVGDTRSSGTDLFLVELDLERQDPAFYAMLRLSTIEHSQRENRGDSERRSILLGLFVRQPSLREKKYFNKPFFWTISKFFFVFRYKVTKRTTNLMAVVPLSFVLAYYADLAYGSKLHRIHGEFYKPSPSSNISL